jgi:cytochrome c-type biogenesis protein CcmE
MNQKFARIALTAVVLVSAFGGLLWYSLQQDTAYYKHVEEVMNNPQQWEGKALQLHGYVVPGSILRGKTDLLEWRFKVESKGSMVDAAYRGIMPDTFKGESEVVLKGRLTPAGFEVAPNGVMAKCPSKYEPKPGFAKPGTPTTTSN